MKKIFIMVMLMLMPCVGWGAEENTTVFYYEVPPSETTYSSVPYISDEAMEQCVILYNKAERLKDTLSSINIKQTDVDQYSQESVDRYNRQVSDYNTKVTELSLMTDSFNRNCAEKQSESAYKATQKLNKEQKGGEYKK